MADKISLYRVGAKFYLDDSAGNQPEALIPIFHRWIQESALPGLLIDVADYGHVPNGPGVMLIAHEGNYAVDFAEGRPGVTYYRKRPDSRPTHELFEQAAVNALTAAALLENETSVGPGFAELTGGFRFYVQDRLLAPNDDATADALHPALDPLVAKLTGGAAVEWVRTPDPRAPFALDACGLPSAKASDLLARIK